jgi:hypothetical protein
MKDAMWILELGLVDMFVELTPVARPRRLRVCGHKKFPEGVPLYYFSFIIP